MTDPAAGADSPMKPPAFEGNLMRYPNAPWENAERTCKHLACPDHRCLKGG